MSAPCGEMCRGKNPKNPQKTPQNPLLKEEPGNRRKESKRAAGMRIEKRLHAFDQGEPLGFALGGSTQRKKKCLLYGGIFGLKDTACISQITAFAYGAGKTLTSRLRKVLQEGAAKGRATCTWRRAKTAIFVRERERACCVRMESAPGRRQKGRREIWRASWRGVFSQKSFSREPRSNEAKG